MSKQRKLKRQKTGGVIPPDLITELPRHVIDGIMEHLPLHDAARMSVLSHKWLDIWRSIPILTFDAQFFKRVFKNKRNNTTHEFYDIATRILIYHSGHLLRFHLEIPVLTSNPDINQWIYHLSKNGVSDISIQNQNQTSLKLSSHIFSCSNIEKLKLQSCIIDPFNNFKGFRKMTCLDLDKTTITSNAFKRLIRGCPLLQELRLTNCIPIQNITIVSPNLCHLTVRGTFKSIYVRNVENLVSAVIGFDKRVDGGVKASLDVLINALANSSNLQKLGFRGHFVKTMYEMFLPPPTFDKLRNLELSSIHLNEVEEFCSIISIIENCPVIERLNISVSTSKIETVHVLDYNHDFVLKCLRYASVEICRGSNMELKLIQFLLECSPILKKISITASTTNGCTFTPELLLHLVRFRRASQMVDVFPELAVSGSIRKPSRF
ncbi:F-box/FBD/LRR-repeat protein At1g13570-like [Silene latifolia]|uniref:F-box/FBD/LRR-repeat protein At1g13570-like n=1 Tax=Silene latifolia TaxID=37657 RepID=UPI003D7813BF